MRNILGFLLTVVILMALSCNNEKDAGPRRITLQSDSMMMISDSTPFYIGKNLYLVIMDYPAPKPALTLGQEIGFLEERVMPGYQHIDSLRRTGIPIFGGVMALKPGCAFIIQANDNLELQKFLKDNPLTETAQVTVIPLVSFGESLFRHQEKLQKLKENQAK
jgi:hypothetical protein